MSGRWWRAAVAAVPVVAGAGSQPDLQRVHLSPIADFTFPKDVHRVPVRVQ